MRISFFEENDLICAYFPDALRYFRVNKTTKNILADIQNGIRRDAILTRYKISDEEFDMVLARIPADTPPVVFPYSPDICRRLVLHIANDCNLACKYCYAKGGAYLSEKGNMPPDVLNRALDSFFSHFGKISSIQLFGGEPCLNLPAVAAVGSYIEKLPASVRPDIYIITNGTLLTEYAINLIKRYDIRITVSLDGYVEVNDRLRTFKDGNGTTAVAENNLRRLTDKAAVPVMIEATYTKMHQETGICYDDIIRYYFDNFGIKNIHIAQASGSYSPDSRRTTKDNISHVFANAKNGYPMPSVIINKLNILKRKKNACQLCDAGLGTYAVSVNGMVYPCFMLTNQTELSMGNIMDKNLFDSSAFREVQGQLLSFDKIARNTCADCFANTVCVGCIGNNYFEEGSVEIPSKKNIVTMSGNC